MVFVSMENKTLGRFSRADSMAEAHAIQFGAFYNFGVRWDGPEVAKRARNFWEYIAA